MDDNREERWTPIEDWLSMRQDLDLRRGAPLGFMTPAGGDEILALRRKRSGPGVSHHSKTLPRHEGTAVLVLAVAGGPTLFDLLGPVCDSMSVLLN